MMEGLTVGGRLVLGISKSLRIYPESYLIAIFCGFLSGSFLFDEILYLTTSMHFFFLKKKKQSMWKWINILSRISFKNKPNSISL